eukprot:PhF_6_TR532/c0_g3_i3/m.385/K00264/GLT1; glutamate synthase (NADPH/NADH)
MTSTSIFEDLPPGDGASGLYCPEYDNHASCGVCLITKISGEPTHDIMLDAKCAVECMKHRGGEGFEPTTGDGAGIMTALPHVFLTAETEALGITLPPLGQYAAGNVFLSPEGMERSGHKIDCQEVFRQCGLDVLGWRQVPTNNSKLGSVAKSRQPHIEQIFVTWSSNTTTQSPPPHTTMPSSNTTTSTTTTSSSNKGLMNLERTVFLARRKIEKQLGGAIHFCSLSTTVIVYKGQLIPDQIYAFYPDLMHPKYMTHFALTHTRFSTNTFPSWARAQPCRVIAHNGEINTLTANANRMGARESTMQSPIYGDDLPHLFPVVDSSGSDSQHLDNALEFMLMAGENYTLPEIMMMVVPEAYENDHTMHPDKRSFYQYTTSMLEPWDGPALFAFSNGRYCGAVLDRNGLRPARYYLTNDGYLIMGSEAGVITLPNKRIQRKGRLQPGRMLLVDTEKQIFVCDEDLKMEVATKYPYMKWVQNIIPMESLVTTLQQSSDGLLNGQQQRLLMTSVASPNSTTSTTNNSNIPFETQLKIFGYSADHIAMLLLPMGASGSEALGSMGTDTPLACLSERPRLLFDYFQQMFAQVTNPPIDPIRESIIMSLDSYLGPSGNLLQRLPGHCHRVLLDTPILTPLQLQALLHMHTKIPQWSTQVIDITFP